MRVRHKYLKHFESFLLSFSVIDLLLKSLLHRKHTLYYCNYFLFVKVCLWPRIWSIWVTVLHAPEKNSILLLHGVSYACVRPSQLIMLLFSILIHTDFQFINSRHYWENFKVSNYNAWSFCFSFLFFIYFEALLLEANTFFYYVFLSGPFSHYIIHNFALESTLPEINRVTPVLNRLVFA